MKRLWEWVDRTQWESNFQVSKNFLYYNRSEIRAKGKMKLKKRWQFPQIERKNVLVDKDTKKKNAAMKILFALVVNEILTLYTIVQR